MHGDCISYEYDVLDRVEKLCYNGAVRYVVTYAKDGTVSQIDDLSENITIISTQGIRFTAGTSISNTAVGVYSGYNIFPNVPAWAPWKLNGD